MEVDGDDLLERVGSHVGELLPVGDPRVRAANVQAAELMHRLVHDALAFARI